jgi:hypothetical protein
VARQGGREADNGITNWGGRYGRKFVNFNRWMTSGKADTYKENDFFRASEKLIFILGLKIFLRPSSFPDPIID